MSNEKFPDMMHFINRYGDGAKYSLHKTEGEDGFRWSCNFYGEEPKSYYASYTAKQIKKNFDSGDWERFYENEEDRPLKFPFVVEAISGNQYTVAKGSIGDMIDLYGEGNACWRNHTTVNTAKELIKGGTWRVVSVGEQESSQKPSEAPTSDRDKGEPLVIQIEVKDAVKAVKELSEAFAELEDVVMRVESRMKRIFGGKFGD